MQSRESAGIGDEVALAQAAAARDASAWALIYERHYPAIYRYVRARVGAESAEDVASEVFVSAVQSIGRFRGQRPLLAWLYGIAKHRVADHYRKARPRESLIERVSRLFGDEDDGDARAAIEALGSSADDPGVGIERLDLGPALAKLTRDQREVLVLRHLVGLTTPEISALMGKRAASVYSLEARALAGLRRHLR